MAIRKSALSSFLVQTQDSRLAGNQQGSAGVRAEGRGHSESSGEVERAGGGGGEGGGGGTGRGGGRPDCKRLWEARSGVGRTQVGAYICVQQPPALVWIVLVSVLIT